MNENMRDKIAAKDGLVDSYYGGRVPPTHIISKMPYKKYKKNTPLKSTRY